MINVCERKKKRKERLINFCQSNVTTRNERPYLVISKKDGLMKANKQTNLKKENSLSPISIKI